MLSIEKQHSEWQHDLCPNPKAAMNSAHYTRVKFIRRFLKAEASSHSFSLLSSPESWVLISGLSFLGSPTVYGSTVCIFSELENIIGKANYFSLEFLLCEKFACSRCFKKKNDFTSPDHINFLITKSVRLFSIGSFPTVNVSSFYVSVNY